MAQLNLIPYSIKIKRENKKKYIRTVFLIILILFIMLGGLYFPYATSKSFKNKEDNLKRQVDKQAYILTERDNLNTQITSISSYINNVDILIKNKAFTYNLIKGLQNSVPKDVVFSTLSYSGSVVTISAKAKTYNSPSEFVANLQTTQLYKNAKLLNINVDEKSNVYIFSVKIDLEGGAL
jgi:Tfp pilus assembly protein PilN